MARGPVIVAVDGSEASLAAARAGVALVRPTVGFLLTIAVELGDPELVHGTGMAGGVMSPSELEALDASRVAEGRERVDAAARALDIDAEVLVVQGSAGHMLCDLARERDATAIIMGTRGRGGIRRAFLGSVSDFVVRNAACPVVITNPTS